MFLDLLVSCISISRFNATRAIVPRRRDGTDNRRWNQQPHLSISITCACMHMQILQRYACNAICAYDMP